VLKKELAIASTGSPPRTTPATVRSQKMQTLEETRPAPPAPAPVVAAHDLTRQYGSGETAVTH
jgi:hypothetical protein